MGKKDKRKVKASKQREKQSKFDTQKVLAFAKRYWYWLVVIPLLIVSIILFCYFQGYFEPKSNVKLTTSAPREIDLIIGKSYNMDVSASDGSEVTYEIMKGDAEILRIDGNVITAILPGETRLVASAGGAKRIFFINSNQAMVSWKIPVGAKYETEIIREFIYNEYGIESYSLGYANTDIVDIVIDETDDKEYFYGVSEGIALIEILNAEEQTTNYSYAVISIQVEDGLKEEDVVMNESIGLDLDELNIDYTNIYEAYDIVVGEYFEIKGIRFDKAGTYHYHQRETDVLKLSSVGRCFGNKEGESIVTVLCVAKDGSLAYTNVKVRVHPIEISEMIYVNEELSTTRLRELYDDDNVVYYTTNDDYVNVIKTPDGYAEAFVPTKEGIKITVSGYNAEGNRIVKYEITVLESKEDVGEEE